MKNESEDDHECSTNSIFQMIDEFEDQDSGLKSCTSNPSIKQGDQQWSETSSFLSSSSGLAIDEVDSSLHVVESNPLTCAQGRNHY